MGIVRVLLFCCCLILATLAHSKTTQEAPEFDLGYGESHFKWGVEVPIKEGESDFKLRIGTRLQAIIENETVRKADGSRAPQDQDFYIRRARLQVEAKFQKDLSYYMDIRADKVDKGESEDSTFALGDAFFQIKNLFKQQALKLRLFRAKYDVSRSQTVSSSRLLIPNRASISDYSSEYISHARRGTNVQILGNWDGRIKTQIVAGDSVHESTFQDAIGGKDVSLNSQNLAYGARIRVSPFSGWEENKLTETFFGHGKHFTLGAGAFFVDNINFTTLGNQTHEIDRKLYNFDLGFHYGSLTLIGEYFVFEGVVENFTTAPMSTGKSDGWVAQAEYVLTQFHYISPYLRVQNWNRFKSNTDFEQNSWLVGLNYYLKGNKLRVGGYLENTDYGQGLTTVGLPDSDTLVGLSLMMHY